MKVRARATVDQIVDRVRDEEAIPENAGTGNRNEAARSVFSASTGIVEKVEAREKIGLEAAAVEKEDASGKVGIELTKLDDSGMAGTDAQTGPRRVSLIAGRIE
jgi:hypothetical protein